MKMKDLLDKLVKTGYSQPTMRKLLLLARNAAQADTVAELMDRCETEDEILAAIAMMETKTAPDDNQE